MNLETRLDERLWDSVRINIENRNFTGAVLDGMYFLGDLIRQRSGVEADGVALIGQAFGGHSPKLRVNRLQTESEWNVQKGIESILRGFYQAIRNPRSHEKLNDNEEDAQALLLFINYIIKIIDQSRSPFVKSEFIKRVLDRDFVPQNRYAELLVSEIPPTQRLPVFIDINRAKLEANPEAFETFINVLINEMNDEEKAEVFDMISEELKTTDDDNIIRLVLRSFSKWWLNIHELARLRIENKLIRSIKEGKYSASLRKCKAGALGTWATRIFEHAVLKTDMYNSLVNKLSSIDKENQDYVFTYLYSSLNKLSIEPGHYLKEVFLKCIRSGDKRFFNAVTENSPWNSESWGSDIEIALLEFQEVSIDDDDIPF